MKKSELKLLVVSLLQRLDALEHGEIWTDALLEDLSPRVRQLESEKDNAQQAIASLLERIQQLEAAHLATTRTTTPAWIYWTPSPVEWGTPYKITCAASSSPSTTP